MLRCQMAHITAFEEVDRALRWRCMCALVESALLYRLIIWRWQIVAWLIFEGMHNQHTLPEPRTILHPVSCISRITLLPLHPGHRINKALAETRLPERRAISLGMKRAMRITRTQHDAMSIALRRTHVSFHCHSSRHSVAEAPGALGVERAASLDATRHRGQTGSLLRSYRSRKHARHRFRFVLGGGCCLLWSAKGSLSTGTPCCSSSCCTIICNAQSASSVSGLQAPKRHRRATAALSCSASA